MLGWRWLDAQKWAARCTVFDGLSNSPLALMCYSIVKMVCSFLCVLEGFRPKGLAIQHITIVCIYSQYQFASWGSVRQRTASALFHSRSVSLSISSTFSFK